METSLLDGVTLAGWRPVPRTYGHAWPGGPTIAELFPKMPPDYDVNACAHPAAWNVVDGVNEGHQDLARPGYGGYRSWAANAGRQGSLPLAEYHDPRTSIAPGWDTLISPMGPSSPLC